MRILMVTLAYDLAVTFGGLVKVVQNNARELVRRGHQVTVHCTNRLDHQRKLAPRTVESWIQGVRIVYCNTWFIPRWRGNFGPSFSPSMAAYLAREGRTFDLVHIHEARTFSTIAAALYARAATALAQDAGLRARIGIAGAEHIRRCYSGDAIGAKLEAVYHRAVEKPARLRVSE